MSRGHGRRRTLISEAIGSIPPHRDLTAEKAEAARERVPNEEVPVTEGPKIELDTIWRRIAGKERVRVKRVWLWPGQGWTVRAHPTHGGKVLVADQIWFLQYYAKVETP